MHRVPTLTDNKFQDFARLLKRFTKTFWEPANGKIQRQTAGIGKYFLQSPLGDLGSVTEFP